MRRRDYREIQTKDQIPNCPEYSEYLNKDYSKLVPTYKHTSLVFDCESGMCVDIDNDPSIHYNNRYDYLDHSEYHRDNYCIIPLNVPAMSLQAKAYILDDDKVKSYIPTVSKVLDLDYDSSFLVPSNSLIDVALKASDKAGKDILLGLLTRDCSCAYPDKPSPCPDSTCSTFVQPLDKIDSMVVAVSDEYAYSWPDEWDMSTLVAHTRTPKQSSSSSSSGIGNGSLVFLCKVDSISPGSGGASIVTINGSGGVSLGGSIQVHFPSL